MLFQYSEWFYVLLASAMIIDKRYVNEATWSVKHKIRINFKTPRS